MGLRIFWHWSIRVIALTHLSSAGAFALLRFNEGRDQIFVNASTSIGYDSNIFANNNAVGDVVTNATLGLEYARRAGLISVNAHVDWNLGSFAGNSGSDFANPSMGAEFVKNTGRTTGAFTLAASQQSQADPNVNQRTDSRNFSAGLNWKYPIIERYSFAGSLDYGLVDYTDNATGLVDLNTYSASLDLFYAYTSQRDLIFGYRIRESDTSSGSNYTDHSLTGGISGKILAKLNGTVRAGYQIRQDNGTGESFGSFTASASTTWTVSSRFTLTGTLSKDFSTTATDSSIDTLRFNLDAQYVFSSRWSLYNGIGVGYSSFLSGFDTGRRDHYFTWSTGINYSLNDHFKASLTYSYFQNWSNRTNSTFERNSLTLTLSTRW